MEALLYTAEEAAKLLKIGKTKLYQEKALGRLGFIKCGRALRFRPEHLKCYIEVLEKETQKKRKKEAFPLSITTNL